MDTHQPQEVGESIFYVLEVKAPDALFQVGTHRVFSNLAEHRDALNALAGSLQDGREYVVIEDRMVDADSHILETFRFRAVRRFDYEHLTV